MKDYSANKWGLQRLGKRRKTKNWKLYLKIAKEPCEVAAYRGIDDAK